MGGIIGKPVYVLQRFYKPEKKFFSSGGPGQPAGMRLRADSGEEKKVPPDNPVLPAPTSLRNAAMMRRRLTLPASPPPAPAPGSFVMMPAANLSPEQWAWQSALYEWAFAAAQAVVQPSIVERDLLGVWN